MRLMTNFKQYQKPNAQIKSEGSLTWVIVIICCSLLALMNYTEKDKDIPQNLPGLQVFASPINQALLYDYPHFYELINEYGALYGYTNLEPQNIDSSSQKKLLETIYTTPPPWIGFYSLAVKNGWQGIQKGLTKYPLFEKIKEGQLWRLFTPCLLHANLLHLLFNMLWLITLGKQMEQRLHPTRYLTFILLAGAFSNTAQYLMSGPNFIGFSGVLCGMLAFTWIRQKRAPWEGYLLDKSTVIFMFAYIFGLAGLQFLSFVSEKSFQLAFPISIANMAHISGGLAGYLLGNLNYFSRRES